MNSGMSLLSGLSQSGIGEIRQAIRGGNCIRLKIGSRNTDASRRSSESTGKPGARAPTRRLEIRWVWQRPNPLDLYASGAGARSHETVGVSAPFGVSRASYASGQK